MEAGKLRYQIDIMTSGTTATSADVYGAPVETFTAVASGVWASIEPLQGREYFMSQERQATIDTKITCRYYPGVKPTQKVVFNSRTFDIKSVINPEERKVTLIMYCLERV